MAKRVVSPQVTKRGKKWQYRIQYKDTEGERVSVSRSGFGSKKEAVATGSSIAKNLGSNIIIPESVKQEMRMDEFFAYWIEHYCVDNVKESTLYGYKKNLRNLILPYIGNLYLTDLNAPTLQNIINDLIKRGYALNRVTAVKGMLTGSLDFAIRMQLIAINPAKAIRLPNNRKLESSHPECMPVPRMPITPEQWNVIISRFPEGVPAHFPLIAGYRLGNRLGEAFGYSWDDVNWSRQKIKVNRQILEKTRTEENGCRWYISNPKYDSFRELEVDTNTFELLKRMKTLQAKYRDWFAEINYDYPEYYIDENDDVRSAPHSQLVPVHWKNIEFINIRPEDGTLITPSIMRHVSRVIHGNANHKGIDAQMGVAYPDFCYHALRHTHGTALIEAESDYKYVTERMGHKNVETTINIYVHATEKLRSKESAILDDLYG